ncbi:DUF3618 domain-containing protein [Actinopolymorpha rutila]|uniref:DUF3618 domain-containing protein n=1 Tax=Actinopolymorpha rutila TaxID=446787 RepID=A0A852ZS91_9ACTN|nr:hypothetical protein [Actinopolymorpha rutila]
MSDSTRPALPDQRAVSNGSRRAYSGPRTAAQIEADLAATRDSLANTVDVLSARVQPKAMAARVTAKAKSFVVNPDGSPRTERLLTIGGGVAGAIGALTLLRYVVRKRG